MPFNAAACCPPRRRPGLRLPPAEWALLAAVALPTLLAALLPAVALPEGYHDFADQRTLLGIPYAMDVLTNLAFALAGAWGLWVLRRVPHGGVSAGQRALAAVFFTGLVLTAASSGYYHVMGPDDAGLCIDRLGMAVAFAGVLGLAAADRVSARAGGWLAALVGVGAVGTAVLHWQTGNMTPWTVLQGGGLVLLALLAMRRPLPGALGFSVVGVIAWYAASKVLEMADAPVFAFTQQIISGHSAKHLVAALAAWPVIRMLVKRENG
ncbi:MAG: hypothetical protein Q4F13_12550 [Pseudomonadota bacterium]|nr:hypothetical protein [Pseudomonadota bacterium]